MCCHLLCQWTSVFIGSHDASRTLDVCPMSAGKHSRRHMCCQLDLVPMRSKGDALAAVKQFAKEIGVDL
jgi:hypothetical protein